MWLRTLGQEFGGFGVWGVKGGGGVTRFGNLFMGFTRLEGCFNGEKGSRV